MVPEEEQVLVKGLCKDNAGVSGQQHGELIQVNGEAGVALEGGLDGPLLLPCCFCLIICQGPI
uniref:Uncharacterized protein n=1 Tax=Arundo donax TaxID=35708 RepID=A0A0A9H4I2_ARUDO